MKWHDVVQGESDWFKLRNGIPTASRFDQILTPVTGVPSVKGRRRLIAELIGERLSTIPPEGLEHYTNRAIRWGQACEEEARRYYAVSVNADVYNGGFCVTDDGRFGCSPDALLGVSGVDEHGQTYLKEVVGSLELKCPQPHTMAEYLIKGTLPSAYRWQVHGHMAVLGTQWCDFLAYCPGFPKQLYTRVERNSETEQLLTAMNAFYAEFQSCLLAVNTGQ